MFLHDKLDWHLSRLEKQAQGTADGELRLQLARALLAKAWFHGGGDAALHEALAQARKVLHRDATDAGGLVAAALALVLLDRGEAADRYLQDAAIPAADDALLHLTRAERALQQGAADVAEEAFSVACRLSPDAWEPHARLGLLLANLVTAPGTPRRRIEHAKYHLVRALQLGAITSVAPSLQHALALLCLRTHRMADAQRLLNRLLDHDGWRAEARYHLGRVAARSDRHKKAILLFRQHLTELGEERAEVWTRIGESYLHLGEPAHAREACHRALALHEDDLGARWVLGSALVAEGAVDEAQRVFRDILERAPDHHDAFAELVRLRTIAGDVRWLRQALRSETAVYDRLPHEATRIDPQTGRAVPIDPRATTRSRIDVLLRGLGRVDPSVTATVVAALDLTTDEGLRFRLWEGALDLLARRRTAEVIDQLAHPGRHYGAAAGRDVLTLAHQLTEAQLVAGLSVQEEDLRRAAVERHGPADDVTQHRRNIALEREEARAWQAMLLLAIASHPGASARNLLVRWASDADSELGLAAQAGLAMMGDADAATFLRQLAGEHALDHLAQRALAPRVATRDIEPARLVSDDDDLVCATCGRRGTQVAHMLVGHDTAVCSVCLATIGERAEELRTRDPGTTCLLTGASLLDADAIYVYQGVAVSNGCVDQSVGHDEREAVDAFLASS